MLVYASDGHGMKCSTGIYSSASPMLRMDSRHKRIHRDSNGRIYVFLVKLFIYWNKRAWSASILWKVKWEHRITNMHICFVFFSNYNTLHEVGKPILSLCEVLVRDLGRSYLITTMHVSFAYARIHFPECTHYFPSSLHIFLSITCKVNINETLNIHNLMYA